MPDRLKKNQFETLEYLSNELREDYQMSVKKAVVDFVLKDPRIQSKAGDRQSREEMFVQIRSSTPTWQTSYQENKKALSDLFMKNNPAIMSIFQIWDKYKS